MKKTLIMLIAALTLLPKAEAQHPTITIYDSTTVNMEESGLSHVIMHKRIKAVNHAGCTQLANIKLDYDPLSAYVEFKSAIIHRNNGTDQEISLENVMDYVAPARMIYWGASQKMITFGHLNPGDEIEYTAYRKGFTYALLQDDDSRYIPPMKGHFYDIVPFWSDQPILNKVYEVSVLTSKNLRWKVYNKAEGFKSSQRVEGNRTIYTFSCTDIQPITAEPNMVANNDIECKLLLSTSPDWQAKSRWFYGVNEDYGSFKPTPEVQEKVNELLKGAESELDSISILTHWVADNIRYCGISMGDGEGFTLHNAQMNFTDRCGVCKDKAGMLITMLRAAGFEAYAAMTMAHERIDDIPADQFNHSVAVVRRHDGTLQPLDPTWVPNVRELWSSAEQQQGYLPGTPDGSDLQVTPLSPAENHYIKIICNSEIDKNGTLTAHLIIEAEGQSDAMVRSVFNARKSEWASNLESELLRIAPNAQIKRIVSSDPEKYLDQPVNIVYEFSVPDYAIIDGKEMTFIPFSAKNIFRRAMSHLNYDLRPESRKYQFTDRCSRLITISENITLPRGFKKFSQENNSMNSKAASYEISYALDGNTFLFNETVRLNKRVYEAVDWPDFRAAAKAQLQAASHYITITK